MRKILTITTGLLMITTSFLVMALMVMWVFGFISGIEKAKQLLIYSFGLYFTSFITYAILLITKKH